jgi:3-oxoacyl-[acyl-carrier protein] reductase
MGFDGKVAVVTGASRGIGRATALALAKENCSVIVNYNKNESKAREVVDAIKGMKSRALAVKCDVSVRNEVEKMFKLTVEEFGKVDILVNNAAIMELPLFMDTTDEVWDRSMNVNLKGVFLCTQIAAGYMKQKRYGKIVNVSSNSGFGVGVWGETAYAAAKAGVIQLTKNAAFELGQYGINVNSLAPGMVATELNERALVMPGIRERTESFSPYGRLCKPEEIRGAVVFLASAASSYMTGATVTVDGGYTAW